MVHPAHDRGLPDHPLGLVRDDELPLVLDFQGVRRVAGGLPAQPDLPEAPLAQQPLFLELLVRQGLSCLLAEVLGFVLLTEPAHIVDHVPHGLVGQLADVNGAGSLQRSPRRKLSGARRPILEGSQEIGDPLFRVPVQQVVLFAVSDRLVDVDIGEVLYDESHSTVAPYLIRSPLPNASVSLNQFDVRVVLVFGAHPIDGGFNLLPDGGEDLSRFEGYALEFLGQERELGSANVGISHEGSAKQHLDVRGSFDELVQVHPLRALEKSLFGQSVDHDVRLAHQVVGGRFVHDDAPVPDGFSRKKDRVRDLLVPDGNVLHEHPSVLDEPDHVHGLALAHQHVALGELPPEDALGQLFKELLRSIVEELAVLEQLERLFVFHDEVRLDRPKGLPGDPVQNAGAGGDDARLPGGVVEEGELAEDVPGIRRGPDLLAVLHEPDGPLRQDVEEIRGVVLIDDPEPLFDLELFHGPHQLLPLLFVQVRQDEVVVLFDDGFHEGSLVLFQLRGFQQLRDGVRKYGFGKNDTRERVGLLLHAEVVLDIIPLVLEVLFHLIDRFIFEQRLHRCLLRRFDRWRQGVS
mmetsp:Transcript_13103/g.30864  ORF Transcript_13103/g.30864 Transcript_13103/m.30864 type:complete len:576 (-) Transcript_13103:110-1837(-)